MNQARKQPLEDPEKKRREYEDRFLAAQGKSLGGDAVMILFAPASLWIMYQFVRSLFEQHYLDLQCLGCAVLFAAVALGGWIIRQDNSRKAHALPYIPPVHEQIAALPAEEVLLRSSDQPTATPEELLRAAQAGAVEPKEELLRAETSLVEVATRL